MIPAGLNHLALAAGDLERSAAFYDRVLGHMGYVRGRVPENVLQSMGTELLAWGCAAGSVTLRPGQPEYRAARHQHGAPGLNHFVLSAPSREDVDGLHALPLEISTTVLDAPADYDYLPEWYAVYFLDPDGIKLEYAFTTEKTAGMFKR